MVVRLHYMAVQTCTGHCHMTVTKKRCNDVEIYSEWVRILDVTSVEASNVSDDSPFTSQPPALDD